MLKFGVSVAMIEGIRKRNVRGRAVSLMIKLEAKLR